MQVTESMVALIVPTRSSSQLNAGDLEFGITSVKKVFEYLCYETSSSMVLWAQGSIAHM